jgi:hypothetical protein
MESKTLQCPYCKKPLEVEIAKTESNRMTLLEKVKHALTKSLNSVDITETNGIVVVTPRGFLGREVWQQINETLKQFNPEWVSEGKESRWIIKQ